ncbi:MAG: copper chaperone [Paucimonas sp.]|nr:copper chaperone [Paucimonas sp.]
MYELIVEGMTCGGCVRRVTRAIQSLDGGADVHVDLSSKTVRVDSTTALSGIRYAIESAGYQVKGGS